MVASSDLLLYRFAVHPVCSYMARRHSAIGYVAWGFPMVKASLFSHPMLVGIEDWFHV